MPDNLKNFREIIKGSDIPIFEPENPNSLEFISEVSRLSADIFIAVGYTNILEETILSGPHLVPVNFHASLLPAYRGKHPVFWCLRNGERWSGMTVHVMDAGIDTGDIIYQVRVQTRKNDTVSSLYKRIMDRSVSLINQLVEDCEDGVLELYPQTRDGASYYSSYNENDFCINWSQDVEEIRRWISTTPGKCFANIKHLKVYFLDASVDHKLFGLQPGQVAYIGRGIGSVSVNNGSISFRQVKLENGKEMKFTEFLHLYEIRETDYLIG
jgi:methionyl-tRNA formyltransferase